MPENIQVEKPCVEHICDVRLALRCTQCIKVLIDKLTLGIQEWPLPKNWIWMVHRLANVAKIDYTVCVS